MTSSRNPERISAIFLECFDDRLFATRFGRYFNSLAFYFSANIHKESSGSLAGADDSLCIITSSLLFAFPEYPLNFQPCFTNTDNVISLYHHRPVNPFSIKKRTVSGILIFQIKLIVSVNDHTVYL